MIKNFTAVILLLFCVNSYSQNFSNNVKGVIKDAFTDETLKNHPEREAVLNGEKRFNAQEARAIYRDLDFLPYSINGYVGCLCGKACDYACYTHLERNKKLCKK